MRFALTLALLAAPAAAYAGSADPDSHQEHAPAASASASAEGAKEEKPKERRVCEVAVSTGSVMPKRVCRTVSQIEADNQAARETRDRMNRRQ